LTLSLPRSGEPIWAETFRIVFQIFFLFLFTMFLVFVIKQVIDSPNVTQRIETAAAQVDSPGKLEIIIHIDIHT
jgi:hypothetical protein